MHHIELTQNPRLRQEGAALIVSMAILVAITLLGLSAATTTQFQEKMAVNTQEVARAFQAAETGLSQAIGDPNLWKFTTTNNENKLAEAAIAGGRNKSEASSTFIAVRGLPKNAGWSALENNKMAAAFFDFQATGKNGGGIEVTINGGAWQAVPDLD